MITVEKLTKRFGPKLAVDNISFSVQKGEVLGFLGPNGAGKSTSMRMITGYLPPSAGNVSVCGFDVVEESLKSRSRIGYLPENAPIYSDMSVLGFLKFCAELRGLFGDAGNKAINRVVQLCFLQPVLHQSVDTLSKGYRHRTCLAQAIIHDPEVLILDEPTDGLDPNQKHEVRTLIRRMGRDKAIIFSTHILEEVEAACTRAIIIDQGKIVANGTPDELKARAPLAGTIIVGLRGATWQSVELELAKLRFLERSELISESDSRVTARLQPKGDLLPEVLELAQRQRWQVEHLNVDEGRLDDVFRSITLPDTKRVSVQ
ncbi:MAG: ATP-binding cassette domain-containing protein [Verrucomicrobia bacterium]|nr:ATP-binding cassette domain-containing protein [Verrucomicrobiota bacterium]